MSTIATTLGFHPRRKIVLNMFATKGFMSWDIKSNEADINYKTPVSTCSPNPSMFREVFQDNLGGFR